MMQLNAPRFGFYKLINWNSQNFNQACVDFTNHPTQNKIGNDYNKRLIGKSHSYLLTNKEMECVDAFTLNGKPKDKIIFLDGLGDTQSTTNYENGTVTRLEGTIIYQPAEKIEDKFTITPNTNCRLVGSTSIYTCKVDEYFGH